MRRKTKKSWREKFIFSTGVWRKVCSSEEIRLSRKAAFRSATPGGKKSVSYDRGSAPTAGKRGA